MYEYVRMVDIWYPRHFSDAPSPEITGDGKKVSFQKWNKKATLQK